MKSLGLMLLIVLQSHLAWSGPDFNQIARRGERASWENAKAWAHYLAVQDFVAVMSQVYLDVATSTIDQQELAFIEANNQILAAAYNNIETKADEVDGEIKNYVYEELSKYASNLKAQFQLSWNPTVQAHAFTQLHEVLNRTVERFEQTCEVGRVSTMADTEIPALRIPSISTNVTISPNLDTVIGISAVVSGGDPDSTWQKQKGPLKMVTQTSIGLYGMAASKAAVAAGASAASAGATAGISLIVEMVFLIVDHMISKHEVRKMRDKQARALKGYYERKARNRDISELYKQNCKVLVSGLKQYSSFVSSKGEARNKILARARSVEFQEEYRQWVLKEQEVDRAACRANLIQNYLAKDCPTYNEPARASKFINQPACDASLQNKKTFAGKKISANEICAKVEVPQENNCRVSSDGVTLKLLNEPGQDKSCRVNSKNYECSADHIADLKLAGRDIERIECETREERARKEKERIQAAWDKTYKKCMKPDPNDTTPQASKKLRCQQQANWAKERAKTKSADQIEKEELEQFQINEKERKKQLAALKIKMEKVAEMLGHFTVLVIDEQQANVDQIKISERIVEAKRKAARERLLRLITLIQKDFGHEDLISEQSGSRKWFELQAKFSLLGAHAINNIVIGQSNEAIVQELHSLMLEFDELASTYPGLGLVAFNDAVENVIRVVK